MPLKLGLSFGQSRTTKPKPRPAPTTAYHAVAIWPPRDACDAARAVKRERVLAQDAPPAAAAAANNVERRVSVGRRAEDRLEFNLASADEPDDLADTYFGYHGKS